MTAALPFLSDAELAALCEGLEQPHAADAAANSPKRQPVARLGQVKPRARAISALQFCAYPVRDCGQGGEWHQIRRSPPSMRDGTAPCGYGVESFLADTGGPLRHSLQDSARCTAMAQADASIQRESWPCQIKEASMMQTPAANR